MLILTQRFYLLLSNKILDYIKVRLCTVPYSVQIYAAQTKRNIQTKFWSTKFKNHVISNSDHFAVMKIKSYVNVTFSSCTFLDNKAAAIRAFQTNVIFRGNNTFPNNSSGSGARLALFMNSYMYLKPSTNLMFVITTIKHCQLEVQYTQILHWSYQD